MPIKRDNSEQGDLHVCTNKQTLWRIFNHTGCTLDIKVLQIHNKIMQGNLFRILQFLTVPMAVKINSAIDKNMVADSWYN